METEEKKDIATETEEKSYAATEINGSKSDDTNSKQLADTDTDDILKKIYENSCKQILYKKIELVCVILCAVALLITAIRIVPRTVKLVDTLQMSADRLDATIDKADKAMEDVSSMAGTVDEIGEEIGTIVGENGDSLTETMKQLSEIDFEGLNQGIQDLQDAVGPLANFMKRFG